MSEVWAGTERQIAWAKDIRRQAAPIVQRWIDEINKACVTRAAGRRRGWYRQDLSAYDEHIAVLKQGLGITDARFWIDNREVPNADHFVRAVRAHLAASPRSNPPAAGSYPVMPYAAAHAWEKQAAARGVSEVSRSPRGFMRAYQRAVAWDNVSDYWRKRREGFLARHIAQAMRGENIWERTRDGTWRPTRRSLAMIMWAFMPPNKQAACVPGRW